jgi:hypothetical protein
MAVLMRIAGIVALLVLSTAPAAAVCKVTGFSSSGSVTPTSWNLGTFAGRNSPPPASITLTITYSYTNTGGPGVCKPGIGFGAAFGSAATSTATLQLAGTPSIRPLAATITAGGANALTVSATAKPTVSVALPTANVNQASGTITTTLQLTLTGAIAAGILTVPQSGTYTTGFVANMFDRAVSTTATVGGSNSLAMNATVTSGCSLSQAAAGPLSMDFTLDIVGGKATGTVPQSVSFLVDCNALSKMQLSSSAMTRSPAGTPSAGFDTQINHRTIATLEAVSTVLTTNGTAPVTVLSPQGTTNGLNKVVTLTTRLIPGNPLAGGIYRGMVSVKIDPTL